MGIDRACTNRSYYVSSLEIACGDALMEETLQTIEDVVAGRLRSPSSLMELSSLEISPRLLQVKNFRLPPLMEIGMSGVLLLVVDRS